MTEIERECNKLIGQLTNWQHQWSRAGSPGGIGKLCLNRCEPKRIKKFLRLKRKRNERV